MADSKSDTRRSGSLSSLSLTPAQAAALSNVDLERKQRGVALSLSGFALVSKSINDLRALASVRAGDA